MDGIGDAIGLDYFEGLPPDLREAVRQCRRDLRTLGPDIETIKRRTAGWDEVRQRLAAQWPDRYGDDMTAEEFDQLMLLSDTRVVAEEAAREKAAHREAEHPDGWSLDSLRIALAESKPETYGLMTNGELAAILRTEGIEVRTIRTGKTTAKGIRKADVDRLMAAREDRPEGCYPTLM
jgi:hypothetical protein